MTEPEKWAALKADIQNAVDEGYRAGLADVLPGARVRDAGRFDAYRHILDLMRRLERRK